MLEGSAGEESSHEFVEHTAEVSVRLRAPSFEALVAEGVRALGELMRRSGLGAHDSEPRLLSVEGRDRESTLVAALNEVVYLAEVEGWAPAEIEAVTVDEAGARIVARGRALERPYTLVKAATLHGLEVREVPGGLEAEVTFDV